ncbi:flagellar motor protein MotB [Telmatospirillum siberiense]|uniref:Motility protein MotB n=1 Tax=Telmatospirillum siberiense TaxID=382514 RepID=A0A2N3Q221_9PROT|nr:flagellar motor protein MotB [Telmatospirillum siberiense]PKU26651.1 motility protein MotB [Telmatospirillum siberiense]
MAQQPIIIKRIKKGDHGAHHGSAWKVAYADFMTAMMAFFLLLWLLSSLSEEQMQGVADYFAPTTVSSSKSGAGGMLGGKVVGEGAMTSQGGTPSVSLSLPPPSIGQGGDDLVASRDDDAEEPGQVRPLTERQIVEVNARQEQQRFDRAQQALRDAINAIPELRKMSDSLMVDNTPEGLRIQIVDQDGLAMFPSGSASMYGHTRALIDLVARVIKQLPEKIAISGHTDSVPFAGQGSYSNWDLSADRALATRRALLESGTPADRVRRVIGNADTEPLLANDPANARNRRMSIVLLRDTRPLPVAELPPEAAKTGNGPVFLQSAGK